MSERQISRGKMTLPAGAAGYVRAKQAASILDVSYGRLRRLAADGHIATHVIPGCRKRYKLADVLKLAPAAENAAS